MIRNKFISNKFPIILFSGLILILGGVFGWNALKAHFIKAFFASYTPPPEAVNTANVEKISWQPYLEAVGNMSALNGVDLSPEVSGQIKAIYFKSGETVSAGIPLIQLDDASERAQLANVNAQLQLAKVNLERSLKLFKQRATTQSALDDAHAKVKQLQANLEDFTSSISKKLIKAPFSGKIGIKQVNVGQFVNAGQVVASLQASKALYVKFSLPQQEIQKISPHQKVKITSDASSSEEFIGYVTAIDSKVNEITRTIEIQAAVDNSLGKLYPGMFVNVKVLLPAQLNTIAVPQTAVNFSLYGESVFIVQPDVKKNKDGRDTAKVKQVLVKTGDKQENLVVIQEGLKPEDIIVTSGVSKLKNDTTILINNSNPI